MTGEEKGTKERHRGRKPAKHEGKGQKARCHGQEHRINGAAPQGKKAKE